MKKKTKNFLLISLVLITLVLISYFSFLSQSFISVQGVPAFEKTESWNIISSDVLIKAPFIGSYSDAPRQSICGTNDGDFSVDNHYSLTSSLFLSSSFSNLDKRGCSSSNEISSEFVSNKDGVLTADIYVVGHESKSGCSRGIIDIYINGKKDRFEGGQIDDGRDCNYQNNPNKIDKIVQFNIKKGDNVKIILNSQIGYFGSSKAEISLDFVPSPSNEIEESPEEIPKEKECIQNIDCISTCGNDIPTCTNNECFCEKKSGEVIKADEKINPLIYLIPIIILSLISLIIYKSVRKRK